MTGHDKRNCPAKVGGVTSGNASTDRVSRFPAGAPTVTPHTGRSAQTARVPTQNNAVLPQNIDEDGNEILEGEESDGN